MNSFEKSKISKYLPQKKEILDLISSVLVAVLLCILLFVFVVVPSEVEGKSMEPNFSTGDRLYTNKLSYWLGDTDFGRSIGLDYQRGDIIVVDPPSEGKSLIKRIIGMPGDRIMLKDGSVYLNGEKLVEPYLFPNIQTRQTGNFIREDEEIIVSCDNPKTIGPDQEGEDCYFALGDNRVNSHDSRNIGLVRRSWIQGKVLLRIWPLNKFTTIPTGIETVTVKED